MAGVVAAFMSATCLFSVAAFAGLPFPWADAFSGNGIDNVNDVATNMGDVYVTGSFTATTDFDPGAGVFELSPAGSSTDAFIAKLDADGNFVWAKAIGGADAKVVAYAIDVDFFGNCYVTGEFASGIAGTVDFDPGDGTFELASQARDAFVVKLDTNGDFVWARRVGGSSEEIGSAIALDGMGNVLSAGHFVSGDFDPDPNEEFNLLRTGKLDAYVWKLDNDGDFVWARAFSGMDNIRAKDIAIDDSNSVYVTGEFEGTADFDPGDGDYSLQAVQLTDIFVAKLDSNGDFALARPMGGSEADEGRGIAVDAMGNFYTTGLFRGNADFDPLGINFLAGSAGESDIFVTKHLSNGVLLWARAMGGTGMDEGNDIVLDGENNIYTIGNFRIDADFDPDNSSSVEVSAIGSSDIFISLLDNDGNFGGVHAMQGFGFDIGTGIDIDDEGSIITAGHFADDFDAGIGTPVLNSVLDFDGFAAKLLEVGVPGDPADINEDGTVDAVDVQLVINAALGLEVMFDTDVNDDAVTNAVDVQLVINAALGVDA